MKNSPAVHNLYQGIPGYIRFDLKYRLSFQTFSWQFEICVIDKMQVTIYIIFVVN